MEILKGGLYRKNDGSILKRKDLVGLTKTHKLVENKDLSEVLSYKYDNFLNLYYYVSIVVSLESYLVKGIDDMVLDKQSDVLVRSWLTTYADPHYSAAKRVLNEDGATTILADIENGDTIHALYGPLRAYSKLIRFLDLYPYKSIEFKNLYKLVKILVVNNAFGNLCGGDKDFDFDISLFTCDHEDVDKVELIIGSKLPDLPNFIIKDMRSRNVYGMVVRGDDSLSMKGN